MISESSFLIHGFLKHGVGCTTGVRRATHAARQPRERKACATAGTGGRMPPGPALRFRTSGGFAPSAATGAENRVNK